MTTDYDKARRYGSRAAATRAARAWNDSADCPLGTTWEVFSTDDGKAVVRTYTPGLDGWLA